MNLPRLWSLVLLVFGAIVTTTQHQARHRVSNRLGPDATGDGATQKYIIEVKKVGLSCQPRDRCQLTCSSGFWHRQRCSACARKVPRSSALLPGVQLQRPLLRSGHRDKYGKLGYSAKHRRRRQRLAGESTAPAARHPPSGFCSSRPPHELLDASMDRSGQTP